MKIASWVLTLMSLISYCDTGQFCIFSLVMNDSNQFASASRELLFRYYENKLCSLNTSEKISRQLCIPKHVSRSNKTLVPCTRKLIVDTITFNIRGKREPSPDLQPCFSCVYLLGLFSVNTTTSNHVPKQSEQAFFHSWFTAGLFYTLVCKTHLIPPLCAYPEQ